MSAASKPATRVRPTRISSYGSHPWALVIEGTDYYAAIPKKMPDGTRYEAYFFRLKREAVQRGRDAGYEVLA